MDKKDFDLYRFKDVPWTGKGDYVSKGGLKIKDLSDMSGLKLKGTVVDLGCGAGGWSQFAAYQPDVTKVISITLSGRTGEETQEKLKIPDTYGCNIIAPLHATDAYTYKPCLCDGLLIDIGETSADQLTEAKRSLKNLETLEHWLNLNPKAMFFVKILAPYDIGVLGKLEHLQNNYGGGIYRSELTREVPV